MSETVAISHVAPTPTATVPRGVPARALSDEVDLYAEGNAFSEADWAGPKITDLFGKDGFNFKDVIDTINPLHHLPVIGTVYRALTGDELAPAPRVLGGTLFGGIAGFVTSLANTVLENETGRDMGDTVLAQFIDDTPGAAVADASAVAPPASPASGAKSGTAMPQAAPKAGSGNTTTPASVAAIKAALGPSTVPGSGEAENPAAALIQARAAVPASPRAPLAAGPTRGVGPAIALPGGKAMPIQFRSSDAHPAAVTAKGKPVQASAPSITLAKTSAKSSAKPQIAEPAGGPRLLRPNKSDVTSGNEAVAAATAATPGQDREISAKMLDALQKYESLMRTRTAPSISGEI